MNDQSTSETKEHKNLNITDSVRRSRRISNKKINYAWPNLLCKMRQEV